MQRRGFLARLLAAPAVLVGVKLAPPALTGWHGLTRSTYPALRANIYGPGLVLTEKMLIDCMNQMKGAYGKRKIVL